MGAEQLIGILRERVADRNVTQVGYTAHENPGDNAISVGEDSLLRRAGLRAPLLIPDIVLMHRLDYALSTLHSTPPNPIILTGGGNITDLYPSVLEGFTALLREFLDRAIILMPSSVYFDDIKAAAPLQSAIARHPDFLMTVRDHRSFERARELFDCEIVLAPDVALTSVPKARGQAEAAIGMVARTDGEIAETRGPLPQLPRINWMTEPRAHQDLRMAPARIHDRFTLPRCIDTRLVRLAARGRLARATGLLNSYSLIITDRLHAVILCIMNGIPVIAVDNSYGKVSSTIKTWNLTELGDVELVGDFSQAEEHARKRFNSASRRVGPRRNRSA